MNVRIETDDNIITTTTDNLVSICNGENVIIVRVKTIKTVTSTREITCDTFAGTNGMILTTKRYAIEFGDNL